MTTSTNTNISTSPLSGLPNELIYRISEYTGDLGVLVTTDVFNDFSESLIKRRDSERKSIESCLFGRISKVTDQRIFIYDKLDEYINQFNLYDKSIVKGNMFKSNHKFTTENKELILKSLVDTVFKLYPEKAFSFLMDIEGIEEVEEGVFAYKTDNYSVIVLNGNSVSIKVIDKKYSNMFIYVCPNYDYDYGFMYCSNIEGVVLPYSVTSINDLAFFGCSNLTSINIPDSVTSIGSCAFFGCSNLTSINIPDSVTIIGHDAFHTCSSLTSIEIPVSVTSIGEFAFKDCKKLISINIPDSVTYIGPETFAGCTSLLSIVIPESVTSFGYGAFRDCPNIKYIVIPKLTTSIEEYTFTGCTNLDSITIPESVISIGTDAFGDCLGIRTINIPDSVTYIGGYAFFGCENLTSIVIPDSVTTIGKCAFSNCKRLESTIPESVIGYRN
jgi:hypothetical protein